MFLINIQGKESIYEQIKTQITRLIELGILKDNDKLPSVRMLASDLGINPNTVERAYAELEKDGIIYTINKKGVFVNSREKESVLLDQAKGAIETLKNEGLKRSDLIKVVNQIYKEGQDA